MMTKQLCVKTIKLRSISLMALLIFTQIGFSKNVNATSAVTNNQVVSINEQNVYLRFDKNITPEQQETLHEWVKHSANALTTVYGEFPVDHFITKIKASKRISGTVPWGEVDRLEPPEVTLVVNTRRTLAELKADWTIYHEFSHLLIPYDAGNERWFSEGLASYYQNILQARSGMFTEQKMWQKLYEGLERGRKQSNFSHQQLSYVSDHIGSNRNYMRIYWSGALYWLKADIALRELSSKQSLDNALKQLRDCCFDEYLSAKEIVQKLDQITNSKVFSQLFDEFSKSYQIPDYFSLFKQLGVTPQNNLIKLKNNATLTNIRRDIFKGQ